MVLAKDIFIGETVEDLATVIYGLNKGIPVLNIFCICYHEKSHNSLEILSSYELFKKLNKEKDYIVLGIAGGKYEAYDLVRYIFQFGLDKNLDIKNLGKELLRS